MKRKALTQIIRDGISSDERMRYDEAYLVFCVFEHHGLILTDAQRAVIADLPKPASVMRIARRELKVRRKERTKS